MTKHNQPAEISACSACGNAIPMIYAYQAWCADCAFGPTWNEIRPDRITEKVEGI